jgi:hypothetical protein
MRSTYLKEWVEMFSEGRGVTLLLAPIPTMIRQPLQYRLDEGNRDEKHIL